MLLFHAKELEALKKEKEELYAKILELTKQKGELELKLFKTFSIVGEFEKDLVEKLELTPLQKSRLDLLLSIESCRLMGIDEDSIIKFEDVGRHINKRKSTEES